MTKKEMFVAIANVAEVAANAEMVEFINHEIELLDKRNTNRSSKPTKAQLEKEAIKAQILAFLEENPRATCAQVADEIGATLHSATGLLTQLRKNHKVMREYDKKTPVYSLGDEGEAEA